MASQWPAYTVRHDRTTRLGSEVGARVVTGPLAARQDRRHYPGAAAILNLLSASVLLSVVLLRAVSDG
eukprot:11181670-Lingulodinium_polyedra.AAC.1